MRTEIAYNREVTGREWRGGSGVQIIGRKQGQKELQIRNPCCRCDGPDVINVRTRTFMRSNTLETIHFFRPSSLLLFSFSLLLIKGTYRVFIKYCVFSLKFCDFSELCCSADVLPAGCVYTH